MYSLCLFLLRLWQKKKCHKKAKRKRKHNNRLGMPRSCPLYSSLSGRPDQTYYPDIQMAAGPVSISSDIPVLPAKALTKLTIKRLLLEKWLFLFTSWCTLVQGAFLLKGYPEMGLSENRTAEGSKNKASWYACTQHCGRQEVTGHNMQATAGFQDAEKKISFTAFPSLLSGRPWAQERKALISGPRAQCS